MQHTDQSVVDKCNKDNDDYSFDNDKISNVGANERKSTRK